MPKINQDIEMFAKIRVIGVGGSGKTAVNHMIESGTEGVEFIAVNADVQDLHHSLAEKKIHIGKNFTKGLGAGMDPEKGHKAAEETKEELTEAIAGADMIFIACGMGGGTGTGASPVIAKIAREQDILTIGVVTKPFFFEGRERMRIAEEGLAELEKEVDAMIVIPNDRILATADKKTSVSDAFAMCNEVLKNAVEGISSLITTPGTFGNIDFADIRTILANSGTALMGVGLGNGENAAADAASEAINSPLLDISINGAKGVLFSISGNADLPMWDVQEAAKIITENIDKDARIIYGTTINDDLNDGEVKVTVIATGFPGLSKSTGASFDKRNDYGTISNKQNIYENKNVQTAAPSSKQVSLKNFFGKTETSTQVEVEIVEEKKVIVVNDDDEEITQTVRTSKSTTTEKKEPEIIAEIDDSDDWSSVPAFIRRNR